MRRLGSVLVLGAVLSAVPWTQARASCAMQTVDLSPSPGWSGDDPRVIDVEPDPTVFAFWRRGLDTTFEVVCEDHDGPLPFTFEELPSLSNTKVGRLAVRTGACTAFVVRPTATQDTYGRTETHYAVSTRAADRDRPQPVVVSAQRENKQFGCGPSSHLSFETNVRPAALRVEVQEGEHEVVVATRLYDAGAEPGEGGRFWLGRTMCRGPNLPEAALGRAMTVRVSALYTDGSTDVGPWQRVEPPEGADPAQDELAWIVEPPPPEPPSPPPCGLAATAQPDADPEPSCMGWLWLFLAIPGALAAVGYGRWRRRRSLHHD